MHKHTKIVVTIGPATESEAIIEQLIHSGMNVARFNTKHGTPEWHKERMQRVRQIADKLGKPIAILLDLQGPEIRLNVPNGDGFEVVMNDEVVFSSQSQEVLAKTHAAQIPQLVVEALQVGNNILVDDGLGEFEVVKKEKDLLVARALGNFKVGHRKTLNTPGVTIDMPSLIANDLEQLDGASNDFVDFVGLSFVRNAQDIAILRKELEKRSLEAAVVAKIENQAAIDHIDEIITAADAVMVARGDLGVELPFVQLAFLQKMLIQKSREQAKPVITATQMLKSMVNSPRPTRAEVTDVANAVYDGTDAVMLSEETTIGKFPVEAVATQAKIVKFNEEHAQPDCVFEPNQDFTSAITFSAIDLLETTDVKINKIVCLTETGRTAQLLSRFRPQSDIFAVTNDHNTYQQLALSYGVTPFLLGSESAEKNNFKDLIELMKKAGVVEKGETILFIHGKNMIKRAMTNTLSLLMIE